MTKILLIGLAMALVIEGLGPLLFPNAWQRYLKELGDMDPAQMRRVGGVLVTIGAVSLWYFL